MKLETTINLINIFFKWHIPSLSVNINWVLWNVVAKSIKTISLYSDVIQRLITCVSGSILSGMDICCFFWHSTHLFPENIKLIRLPGCQLSNEQKIFPIFSPHKIRLNFIFWQGKCFCETFYNFKLNLENNKWCTAWHFSLLYSNICWNSQSSGDNQTNLLIIFKICQLDPTRKGLGVLTHGSASHNILLDFR